MVHQLMTVADDNLLFEEFVNAIRLTNRIGDSSVARETSRKTLITAFIRMHKFQNFVVRKRQILLWICSWVLTFSIL